MHSRAWQEMYALCQPINPLHRIQITQKVSLPQKKGQPIRRPIIHAHYTITKIQDMLQQLNVLSLNPVIDRLNG
jgi:hypothetical protein